jgi:hypothetical protein
MNLGNEKSEQRGIVPVARAEDQISTQKKVLTCANKNRLKEVETNSDEAGTWSRVARTGEEQQKELNPATPKQSGEKRISQARSKNQFFHCI